MNNIDNPTSTINEVKKTISKDRQRTNLLHKPEQAALAWLVTRVPPYISSDGLTAIGLFGNALVALSFVLAQNSRFFLLLAIPALVINWLGDSLDGRLAYYRKKPRKWYGFMLDITVDWIGIILIGIGFMLYVGPESYMVGFLFVVLYGWEMLTALLRYKIIGKYSIDSGIMGPTEVRFLIAFMIILEIIVPGIIPYLGGIACAFLVITNITDFYKLIQMADARDKEERKIKIAQDKSA